MPVLAGAQISFSEIMYDPEGADTGREWVEVYNDSGASVDISAYKFFEGGTNHGLTAVDGAGIIPGNGYAVIADDPAKFKIDFPNFAGIIFDSSFSLKNDGEDISFKDKNLTVIDTVTYSSEAGATSDGNSLQKINGAWIAAIPTPGSDTPSAGDTLNENNGGQTTSSSETAPVNNFISGFPTEPQMFVEAGSNKTTVAGALVIFDGIAFGLKKEPIENARYTWSFGDGVYKEGKSVTHIYRYPGEYVVVLEVASGYFSGSDRLKVQATKANVVISGIGDKADYFVEVLNNSKYELDLSGWILRSGGEQFFIPKNTIIMSGGKVIFSSIATGFSFKINDKPELLYPSGATAATYGDFVAETTVQKTPEIVSNTEAPAVVKKAVSSQESNRNVTASAVLALDEPQSEPEEQSRPFPLKWLLAVGALSAVAIGGIMLSGASAGKKPDELSADDFEIEEEDID